MENQKIVSTQELHFIIFNRGICKSTCFAFKLVQSNLKCSLRTLTSEGALDINIYQINIYQVLHKASNFVIKEKKSIGV